MRGAWTLLLLLGTVLAGCARDGADDVAIGVPRNEADALAALDAALVGFHDHADPALHPGASWGVAEVFRTTLPMDGSAPASPPSEFTLWGDYAFVSTFHPAAGFHVLDLTDPAHPRQVGRYDAGTAYTNDVEVSPDGKWAFVPTQPMQTAEDSPLSGGVPFVADFGVQAVDISDPTAPRLAAFYNANAGPYYTPTTAPAFGPAGYHRLDVMEIGGALHVFGTNNGLARIDILRFDPEPVPALILVGAYQSPAGMEAMLARTDGWASTNVHDVTVGPDPLEGFPLMAVAHWEAGVHFVDVSDPAAPRLLGVWDEFTDVLPGNVHNVEFTAIEGRRVAVAVPEYPSDYERQGIVWLIDATDFAAPANLGSWSLPGLHPVEGGVYVFTTDRTEIVNGTLVVPHFHAGVVLLDVSTLAKAAAPELIGYVVPAGQTAIPYQGFTINPVIYDAIPRGRHLYYSDLLGGFHVAEMDDRVLRGRPSL